MNYSGKIPCADYRKTTGVFQRHYALRRINPNRRTSTFSILKLIGKKLTQETLGATAAMIRQNVSPIDDVRAEAVYRRTVAGNPLLWLVGETV